MQPIPSLAIVDPRHQPSDRATEGCIDPHPWLQGMVDTVVSFSRCLYAQMVGQGYEPPRRYPLPLPSEPGFASAQLGMKLVAGFEMLLAQASPEGAPGAAPALVMFPVLGYSDVCIDWGLASQNWLLGLSHIAGSPFQAVHLLGRGWT